MITLRARISYIISHFMSNLTRNVSWQIVFTARRELVWKHSGLLCNESLLMFAQKIRSLTLATLLFFFLWRSRVKLVELVEFSSLVRSVKEIPSLPSCTCEQFSQSVLLEETHKLGVLSSNSLKRRSEQLLLSRVLMTRTSLFWMLKGLRKGLLLDTLEKHCKPDWKVFWRLVSLWACCVWSLTVNPLKNSSWKEWNGSLSSGSLMTPPFLSAK